MTNDQEQIIAHVQLQIKPDEEVSEAKIAQLVNIFRALNPISDEEAQEVITELQTKLAIKMDRGACVKEKNHVSWYYAKKKDISPKFWLRYSTYLYKEAGFNSGVMTSLDSATDEMMDLLSDPTLPYGFQRRGLVIGDVQSGKTSTYLALMNKAADAGYHIIILLTGTIEKLRRQTQGRTDSGFVGLDSTAFNKNKDTVYVGVGNIDKSVSGWAVTSTISDFNTGTANKLSGQLSSISDPVVFVLKKNKSVLEKLESWLRLFNANPHTGQIDSPMIMIDDEADNASVNAKSGEDPATINRCIRSILKLFSKSAYVGFTATPYANIFIDPDSTAEMLGDDLFPRDFIYALEAPTNYIGAASIFPEGAKHHRMIQSNNDCESYVPLKHKKTYDPGTLPLSLQKAVASFMLTNAVRDLRGQEKKHRTMMVNISVYVDVQKKIAEQLEEYVRDIQREVQNYYKTKQALQYASFAFLKEVYDEFFSSCEFSWAQIQDVLNSAIAPIVVRYVNGGNAAKNLNYDDNEENGLRLIAVGGYSLSRGLTLEGLSTSYFYRNTKMYDTLMQMGRWFGYRPHYEDLCQIWINNDAVEWYSYISEASDELKREVRRMQAEKRTPDDFGLCVRSDKATLLVTARNKMKTAKDYTMTISLSGNVIETPYLHTSEKIQADNLNATMYLFNTLLEHGYAVTINDKKYKLSEKPQFINVPKEYILNYIRSFKSHSLNSNFHTSEIEKMISNNDDGALDFWDITIATGTGSHLIEVGNQKYRSAYLSFALRDEYSAIQMQGSKARIGSIRYAVGGLTIDQVKRVEDGEHAIQRILYGETRDVTQTAYFKPDFYETPRRPLLVIYPVDLKVATRKIDSTPEQLSAIDKQEEFASKITKPLIGISIGIPAIKGQAPLKYQYKINLIKYREITGLDEPDEIDDTIED